MIDPTSTITNSAGHSLQSKERLFAPTHTYTHAGKVTTTPRPVTGVVVHFRAIENPVHCVIVSILSYAKHPSAVENAIGTAFTIESHSDHYARVRR